MAGRRMATNGRHYDGGGNKGGSYRSFSDVPDGDSKDIFSGEGQAQLDFFRNHSNNESLVPRMQAESKSFDNWVSGMYMDGEQYKGWDTMSIWAKVDTQAFDDIMDRSVLNEGLVVRRNAGASLVLGKGHSEVTLAELQAMKGRIITAKGNMSTSAAAQGLDIGSKKPIEYTIKFPKGSKGAGVYIGDRRVNKFAGASEREFMTNRDVSFRVGKTTWDSSRQIFKTELTFIGRQEHDYGTTGRLPQDFKVKGV